MATPDIFGFDRSDTRGIGALLERLPGVWRVHWLKWCCRQVKGPGGSEVVVTTTTGTSADVYLDWLTLCHSCGLSAETSRLELERLVRQHGVPLSFTAGAIELKENRQWPSQPSSPAATQAH